MRIIRSWSDIPPEPHVVTIGNFDGVHRGHQYLLTTVHERAATRGLPSLAITFDPLPLEILAPERAPQRLSLTDQRLRLILACGIDRVLLVQFDRSFAALSPKEFVDLLVQSTHLTTIVVGEDFHFGRGRTGDPALLRELGRSHGFEVVVLPRLSELSETISSSRIRQLIAAGAVREAGTLLGRPYALTGTVVAGKGRGSQLGFPTANIAVADRLMLPGDGIYAAIAHLSGSWYPALAYIGSRPTFPGAGHAVEVYLIDQTYPTLRGETITVYFIERIRPDRAFPDAEALVEQMRDDERNGRAVLQAAMADWPPPLVQALHAALEGVEVIDDPGS